MLNTPSHSFLKKIFAASRNVFWFVFWLASLGLTLLYPLRWLFGEALKPVRMAAYITPWLLVFSLPALIIASLAGRKWLVLLLTFPTLAIVFTFAPLFLPNRQTPPSPGDFSLKVMSYNLHGLREIGGIVEVVRQEQPDILLIQEYSAALVSPSFHGLDDLYPQLYVEVAPAGFGQAIFSRYPLKRVGADLNKGRVQKLLVDTPAGSIAVWNVHPIPPYLIPPERYDAHLSALLADLATVQGPLILGGDFNVTDQSATYRLLTHYLKDAYWEAGWGFGFSYPAPPYTFLDSGLQTGPLWRIDHLFHSPDLVVNNIQTLQNSGGSDHFPVVANFSWMK